MSITIGRCEVERSRIVIGLFGIAALLGTAACAELRIATSPKTRRARSVSRIYGVDVSDHREKQALRFAVLGDAGTGGPNQTAVARAMHAACGEKGACDFVLVTGDNVYETGARPLKEAGSKKALAEYRRKFEEPYAAFGRTDFWLVAGNHDWYRSGSPDSEVRYSGRSERWRMFGVDYAVPNLPDWIAIYGIETTLLMQHVPTSQVSRARERLCAARGWKILFGHHPVYSPGRRHGGEDGTLERIRETLVEPLLEPCEVDLYVSGHEHLQAYLETPGFDQIIQGAGGARLYRVRKRFRFPPEDRVEVAEARSSHGFAIIDATPESLTVTFYVVTDQGAEPFYERVLSRDP